MFRRSIPPLLICMVFALQMQAAARKPHVSLKKQIETILSQPDLSRGFWGIENSSVANGQVLYCLNPEKIYRAASNSMLYTTKATLVLIVLDFDVTTMSEINRTC